MGNELDAEVRRYTSVKNNEDGWGALAAALLQRVWVDWWVQRHYFYCTLCGCVFHRDGVLSGRLKCTSTACARLGKNRGVYDPGDPGSKVVLENSIYLYRAEIEDFFYRGEVFPVLCESLDLDSEIIIRQIKKCSRC